MAKVYGVKNGRKIGIFNTWDECSEQVTKFPGALYKSFTDEREARLYVYGTDSQEDKGLSEETLNEIKNSLHQILNGVKNSDKLDIYGAVQDIAMLLNINIDGISNVVDFLD